MATTVELCSKWLLLWGEDVGSGQNVVPLEIRVRASELPQGGEPCCAVDINTCARPRRDAAEFPPLDAERDDGCVVFIRLSRKRVDPACQRKLQGAAT